jgi:type VI secretion system protein ImpJ
LQGYVYHELDRTNPTGPDVVKVKSLGLFVAGDWPDLKIEFWWVRRNRR